MTKRLYLIDGMAILFRGYFALIATKLSTKSGEPTGGTFAFCSALERLLERHKPDLIAVAWDSQAPTFRHDQFEAYKANRAAFPEELVPQLARVKEIVGYYHIPCLQMDGYEADDIIGTIAKRAERDDYEVFCVTPDKDFLQLVSEKVFVYKPSRPGADEEIVDIAGVEKRFGVRPDQVIDVLALIGDASDNVPGVKGIGEKTAIPLIQQYGSVEGLYEHIDEITKKGLKQKLVDGTDIAKLSKELVTIECNVPIDCSYEDLHLDPPDVPALLRIYDELGFKSLAARYQAISYQAVVTESISAKSDNDPVGDAAEPVVAADDATDFEFGQAPVKTIADIPHDYKGVDTLERLKEVTAYLAKGPVLSFDLETDALDVMTANILGFALSTKVGEGFYIPIANSAISKQVPGDTLFEQEKVEEKKATEGLELDVVLDHLRPLLVDPALAKTGQNAKYDMALLRRHDVLVEPLSFDSMLASYVIDSTQSHGMDALAERYLGYKPVSITELIGVKGKGQLTMRDVPLATVIEYAAEDADITLQLHDRLKKELEQKELQTVAEQYEFPLVEVLVEMEYCGIKIDVGALSDISRSLQTTMTALEKEIHELAGHPFNIGSPKQLTTVLFEELKLPTKRKTKTGYSTDQFVMEELAALHPLPEKILEYRQASKLKSTYVDALPSLISERSGRIHTSYNQAVTSTGRLSSVNPNLQNIPIRSEMGQEIRKAFVPGIEGGALMAADYSQIELRIMAHICGDEALVSAFREGFDVHTATAMNVFGVTADEVTGNMRRKAKEVNFGIMYGIGAFGLARRLKIPRAESQELITTYFAKYPGVQNYIQTTLDFARTKGYVETLSGRRRYYPNINDVNQNSRSAEERAAINMPIQGTASDIIKLAMINIHKDLRKNFKRTSMLLQVHDELVFETPLEQVDELAAWVKEKMESAFSLGEVSLIAETGHGANWYEAH